MFHSLRYNIYFFLILLAAVFSLWLVHYSGNKAIRNHQHVHARIATLNNQFSQSILKESKNIDKGNGFDQVLNSQRLLFKQCSSCHAPKTNLPEQRLNALTKKHTVLLKTSALRNDTQQRLSSLFDSVHYIHEHHIVTLKNYLQYTREHKELLDRKNLQKIYAGEAALEPDIIRQAVEIQHQLANIIYDFNMLTSGDNPGQIHDAFKVHIQSFYRAVTAFEEYSLDAQDGLLVEELLESGRTLDTNFIELVKLETENRALSVVLETNHAAFETAFSRLEIALQQQQEILIRRMTVVNWISLLLAGCLALAFLFRARTIVKAVDNLVDETRKITNDISYQIPEQPSPLSEFTVLRSALNKMSGKLNHEVRALSEEIQVRRRVESLLGREKDEW